MFITLQNTCRVPVQVRPRYQGQWSNLNFDTADRPVNIDLILSKWKWGIAEVWSNCILSQNVHAREFRVINLDFYSTVIS